MEYMKQLVRDGLIWCVWAMGVVSLYARWKQRHGPLVRVLCFHDVTDQEWFASVLTVLTQRYHVITPAQFAAKEFDPDIINILLTFDDGYASWIEVVQPVLESHGCKGLFFVSSGLLDAEAAGQEAANEFVKAQLKLTTTRRLLSWDAVRTLAAAGHTIGGHTVTHRSLGQLDTEEVRREVIEDKRNIEEGIDQEITHFAFPFGRAEDVSDESIAIATEMYDFCYSANSGFVSKQQLLPRTLVDQNLSPKQIMIWSAGGYDMLC